MATFTVERSRVIDTAVERVFPLVNDFTQWPRWSPWEQLDPEMKRAYAGQPAGPGAVYAWSGNRKAGAGRMEITGAEEPHRVEVALHFDKPFRSDNTVTFELRPEGERTRVTWRMVGPRPLLMRLAGPLLNMEKLVGRDMDRGLEQMALVAP